MIRNLWRSLVSAFCRHDWHQVHCLARCDWAGNPLPLDYMACWKCGLRDDGGWDD